MINLRFIPRLALLRSIWIHPIQSKDRNNHSFPKWISSGPITPYRLFVSWPPRYTHTYTHTRVCHPPFYEWTRHVESLSRRNNHGFSLRPTSICYCPFHAKIYAPWNYEAPLSSKSSTLRVSYARGECEGRDRKGLQVNRWFFSHYWLKET